MRFQPGNVHMFNGKGGRPRGSKTKLTSKVYDDLLRHWNEPATPGSDQGAAGARDRISHRACALSAIGGLDVTQGVFARLASY